MTVPLMLSLVALAAAPPSLLSKPPDRPVHVWLSDDGNYEFGDRAKVHVQASQDGYLIVLHADPNGRVRVLFPVDPTLDLDLTPSPNEVIVGRVDGEENSDATDDHFVRGGRKVEIKGRGDRVAFVADDTVGK